MPTKIDNSALALGGQLAERAQLLGLSNSRVAMLARIDRDTVARLYSGGAVSIGVLVSVCNVLDVRLELSPLVEELTTMEKGHIFAYLG